MKSFTFVLALVMVLCTSQTSNAQLYSQQEKPKEEPKSFQESMQYAQKPVPCNDVDRIFKQAQKLGLKPAFGGMALTQIPSPNGIISLPMTVYLFANLETGQWIIVETNQLRPEQPQKGCIISQGKEPNFDPQMLKMLTTPTDKK